MSKTIQQNIERVEVLEERIEEHCLCLQFAYLNPGYIVNLPYGYSPQTIHENTSTCGKIKALESILRQLETAWVNSFCTWSELKREATLEHNLKGLLA